MSKSFKKKASKKSSKIITKNEILNELKELTTTYLKVKRFDDSLINEMFKKINVELLGKCELLKNESDFSDVYCLIKIVMYTILLSSNSTIQLIKKDKTLENFIIENTIKQIKIANLMQEIVKKNIHIKFKLLCEEFLKTMDEYIDDEHIDDDDDESLETINSLLINTIQSFV